MRTIVFVNGWPDDPEVWKEQVKFFSKTFHCVAFQIPGFSDGSPHDFPKLRDLLAEQIKEQKIPVILVGHDWGAYLAYMVVERYPELVEKIIALDVGAETGPQNFLDSLLILTYQGVLISSWKLRNIFPQAAQKISLRMAHLMHSPYPNKVSVNKNFIYYYFWRDLIVAKKNLLARSDVSRPLLYFYASKKRPMFQSKRWTEKMQSHPGNRIEALPTRDHWFMLSRADQVNRVMQEWLQ